MIPSTRSSAGCAGYVRSIGCNSRSPKGKMLSRTKAPSKPLPSQRAKRLRWNATATTTEASKMTTHVSGCNSAPISFEAMKKTVSISGLSHQRA